MTSVSSHERDQPGGLALLGGFAFGLGGAPPPSISSGSQRLLACLALAVAIGDGVMTRRQVAATLWPDASREQAAASLRSAVSRLEGPARGAVRVSAEELSLAEGTLVDVCQARALARRLIDSHLPPSHDDISAAAVSALSEDLLPGWYDDWVVIAAEEWRELRFLALEALAVRLIADGRWAEATAAAQMAVRAEPLKESARALLIEAHLGEGNQSEALAEFERYRAMLRAQLGVEPTARLRKILPDVEPRPLPSRWIRRPPAIEPDLMAS